MVNMVNTMKNGTFGTRVLILLVIVFAVIGAGFLLNNERKNTASKRTELSGLKNDLSRLDTLLVDYEKSGEKLLQAEKTLPKSYEEVSVVIAQFEEAAARHGQGLEVQIKDTSHAEQGGVASIDVTLTTTGSYSGFSQMLSTISSLPYHTRLDALDISGSESGLQNKATLRVFIQEK